MAMFLDADVIKETAYVYATVELQGKVTRGQMALDWSGNHGNIPNITLVTELDTDRYVKLLGHV